ncbi:MAG: hypothetical protein WCO04_19115 [Pseudomonadota bacterium]
MSGGPFAAFLAKPERVDAQRGVWLRIDVMGCATRFSAEAEQLFAQRLDR